MLGTLVDMAPSILIATPILLPVMQNFGVDPVHFGMIMLLNLGIGLCHPPVGAILFVGCAVGKVTIEQVMRKIWPFYAVMFLVLMCRHLYPRGVAVAASARAAMSRQALGKQALGKQALGKVDKRHVFSRIEDDRCSADSFKLHQSCRRCGTDIVPHAVCLDWS